MDIATIKYIVDTPENLTEQQKDQFQKMLLVQEQVNNPSMDKIKACPFLCLAYDEKLPIGIGAIKEVYKTPFKKAEIHELKDKYDMELGYLFVSGNDKYRGKGIAKAICTKLLEKVKSDNVFATTEESDDNTMKWILQKFGFERSGKIYTGPKTKKSIGLYLLTRPEIETTSF